MVSSGEADASSRIVVTNQNDVPTWDTFKRNAFAPILVAGAVLALMAVTVRDYGLTTDEPVYILNAERLTAWFADLFQKGPAFAFAAERVREGVHFAEPDSKNLPVVSLFAALGHLTVGRFDTPPASYRWGNLFVFAATCGVMFHWLRVRFSTTTACVGIAALIGMPRMFAHAQLLNIDTLVGCFWVLASWALSNSRGNWRWSFLFGVLCGIGMMTKPTFWFAVPVWILWGLIFRPRELWRAAVCLGTVTPLVALFLMPPWWSNPLAGFFGYIHMLRHDETGWQIDAYYLGEVYQMTGLAPVPWHSVILLPLVTTPVWILLLAAVGVIHWLRRERNSDLLALWVGSGAVLPLIVMLPSTPAHDGVRLYRASFFFLALLAAYGFESLRTRFSENDSLQEGRSPRPRKLIESLTVSAIALLAAYPLWAMHPGQLSYYNFTTGGLRGASKPRPSDTLPGNPNRPRFEIAYWWAAMNREAWSEMQKHIPADGKLWIFPEHFGLDRLEKWGHLRKDIQVVGPDDADYLLIYGRLGRLMDPRSGRLGELFLTGEPLWEKRIDDTRAAALFQLKRE